MRVRYREAGLEKYISRCGKSSGVSLFAQFGFAGDLVFCGFAGDLVFCGDLGRDRARLGQVEKKRENVWVRSGWGKVWAKVGFEGRLGKFWD